jgi:hypothetical protein
MRYFRSKRKDSHIINPEQSRATKPTRYLFDMPTYAKYTAKTNNAISPTKNVKGALAELKNIYCFSMTIFSNITQCIFFLAVASILFS